MRKVELRSDRPVRAEVHQTIGHGRALLGLFRELGIPYDAVIHDYSWFCPRINLIGPENRFLAISSGSKYIELAGDEVDHRL